jgi:aldehyde:ferredoxin oxidoreductase
MEAPPDPFYEVIDDFHHYFEPLGLVEPVDRMDFGPQKVRASIHRRCGACEIASACVPFGTPTGALKLEALREYVNAATGWNMSLFEMVKVGERANTRARLFNLREGFTAADDLLPSRLFEPLQNGALEGMTLDRDAFDHALQIYSDGRMGRTGCADSWEAAELGLTAIDAKGDR